MVGAALVLEDVIAELVEGVLVEAVRARGVRSLLAVELPPLVLVDQRLVGSALRKEYCLASMKTFCAAGSGFLSG